VRTKPDGKENDNGSEMFVQDKKAPILCVLRLLLGSGQHPKLLVIVITVTLHRPGRSRQCSCRTKLFHMVQKCPRSEELTEVNKAQEG